MNFLSKLFAFFKPCRNQHVRDDWTHHHDPSPEELATSNAIEQVAAGIDAEGISYVEDYEPCMTGDPLRDLMRAP